MEMNGAHYATAHGSFFLPYFLEHEHIKFSQNMLRLFFILSKDQTSNMR